MNNIQASSIYFSTQNNNKTLDPQTPVKYQDTPKKIEINCIEPSVHCVPVSPFSMGYDVGI